MTNDVLDLADDPLGLLSTRASTLTSADVAATQAGGVAFVDDLSREAVHREMQAVSRAARLVNVANIRVPLLPDDNLFQGLATSEDVSPYLGEYAFNRAMPGPTAALRAAPLAPRLPSAPPASDIAPESAATTTVAPSGSPMARAHQAVVATPTESLATATALAGSAATILGLVGFALYHRIRANATLDNDTRKAIFSAVCANPGLGVHTIAEQAGVSYSTATYHLERLVGAGMLVMTPDGNKLCYYKNGGAFTESERKILPILKNDEATRLLEAILDSPGTYRAALAERLGVTATTINWHLRRLRDAGLVYENRQGRNAYLYANSEGIRASIAGLAAKLTDHEGDVAARLQRYVALTGGSVGAGSA